MALTLGNSVITLLAFGMSFAGGMILWQIFNGVGVTNGNYMFPYELAILGFASLPVYYAGDVALGLITVGFLLAITVVRKGGNVVIGK